MVHTRLRQALREVAGPVRNAEFLRDFLRLLWVAAGERNHLNVGDLRQRLEVLDAESALPCQNNLDDLGHDAYLFSRIRCPRAVLDEGT